MLPVQPKMTAAPELAGYFSLGIFQFNSKTTTSYFLGGQEIVSSNPDEVEEFQGLALVRACCLPFLAIYHDCSA